MLWPSARESLAGFDSTTWAWQFHAMALTPTRNISLTAELDQYIKAQVASGHYSNASEVVRAALRLLIQSEQPAKAARSRISPSNHP